MSLTTGNQLKAARALAGLDQKATADLAGISVNTVRNMEAYGPGLISGSITTLRKVQAALEAAGVIFVPENGEGAGVRLRKDKA